MNFLSLSAQVEADAHRCANQPQWLLFDSRLPCYHATNTALLKATEDLNPTYAFTVHSPFDFSVGFGSAYSSYVMSFRVDPPAFINSFFIFTPRLLAHLFPSPLQYM